MEPQLITAEAVGGPEVDKRGPRQDVSPSLHIQLPEISYVSAEGLKRKAIMRFANISIELFQCKNR